MSAVRRQVRVCYEGEVQGVGFRFTVRGIAERLGGLTGGVENVTDGSVQLIAEGPEDLLKRLLLQIQTSRLGMYIREVKVSWGEPEGLVGFYYR